MKNRLKLLSLSAILLASAPMALADQISFFGTDTYNSAAKTISFTSSIVGVGGTGILSPFTTASTAAFVPTFNYGLIPMGGQLLFTVTAPTGQVLRYVVSSITNVLDNLEIEGMGVYTLTNGSTVTSANGMFDLTTQAYTAGGPAVTFSDTNFVTATTPEPSSLMLLGTGLLSGGGMLFRRRRSVA